MVKKSRLQKIISHYNRTKLKIFVFLLIFCIKVIQVNLNVFYKNVIKKLTEV